MLMYQCYALDNSLFVICDHWARQVVKTNIDCYANRQQNDIEKITKDITCGKIAEWGVFFMLKNRLGSEGLQLPDMAIYSAKQKSFSADICNTVTGHRFHVKSQTRESRERYGQSWLFEAKDSLFEKSDNNDIIIACEVSLGRMPTVEIVLEKQFNELVFGEPKLKRLSTKKALYLEDNI